jgi:hypothetical protein
MVLHVCNAFAGFCSYCMLRSCPAGVCFIGGAALVCLVCVYILYSMPEWLWCVYNTAEV